MQRIGSQYGTNGGDVDLKSTARLQGGQGRAADLCQPVVGQKRRRRSHLVEGQRRSQADVRASR